ncbi:hypothetical protein ACIBJI_24700 [Nocardia sp. NPDC050408]|uniref:hypothetical protein n=1 Tax=Nocardia sp. NPDC050408 TaxID=3364319 RepID=UPI0037AD7C68
MTEGIPPEKEARRAEPIDKRTAKNGTVPYTFPIDVGTKSNGKQDRQRFTHNTLTEARHEYRRITSEIAARKYVRLTDLTVDEARNEWIASRRTVDDTPAR